MPHPEIDDFRIEPPLYPLASNVFHSWNQILTPVFIIPCETCKTRLYDYIEGRSFLAYRIVDDASAIGEDI
jgi:hypothetical protein